MQLYARGTVSIFGKTFNTCTSFYLAMATAAATTTSPAISFLDLPAEYYLPINDMIHFTPSSSLATQLSSNDKSTGAGVVLASKIIDALRNWNFSPHEERDRFTEEEIARVGVLVERNLYTCHSGQVQAEVGGMVEGEGEVVVDEARVMVELMLRGLLDKDVKRDRAVNLNSNEMVVFINFDADKAGRLDVQFVDMCNSIAHIVVSEMQEKWNIWPVRVYAGVFLPSDTHAVEDSVSMESVPAFSITLLNVVNTDIGGPSMPQLLDQDCDAPLWHRFLKKEVWRERELVSREYLPRAVYQQIGGAFDLDNASERSVGSARDDESVGSDVVNPAVLEESQEDDPLSDDHIPSWKERSLFDDEDDYQQQFPAVEDSRQTEVQPPPQSEPLPTDDAENKEKERQNLVEEETEQPPLEHDFEPPRRDVEHPTWERHHDSMSLLDLIRSQASMIAPFGTNAAGKEASDVAGTVAGPVQPKEASPTSAEESEDAQAKSSSDEEFVVV